ncbi:MAG: serine/threonine-protein phosphatase [Clostridia bacterium]|nr:serine/threonine-protein phosphatase [Clostridia bacterium]
MINYEDEYQAYNSNEILEITVLSLKGNRILQEDCVGYVLKRKEGIVVLCDGMGGHDGGQMASRTAVEGFLQAYNTYDESVSVQEFLLATLDGLDRTIHGLKRSDGNLMQAGTTITAIYIQDNRLFWVSAGDSRLYAIRNREMVQITKDHTYRMLLDLRKSKGEISQEEYKTEIKRGQMLISFLGVGGLPYVENNKAPFMLQGDDLLVLMSDGIYKLLEPKEMEELFQSGRVTEMVSGIQAKVAASAQKNIDNLTIAIVKIK